MNGRAAHDSASTPGSGLPSISSSDAPPPVERWSTRSASPNCASAAAESPPPTTVVAVASRPPPRRPRACRPRTARARTRPSGRSRTPCRRRAIASRVALGRARRRRRAPSSRRARRRRRASRTLGVGVERARRRRGRSAARSLSPPPRARARAGSTPSSSHSESPTSWPWALKNGKHIAPPIRTASARSRNASSTPILSVTLAPPTTATSGRCGSSRMPRERRDLALEQRPGGARQQVRDALGGGVRAVRGAERVVDVDVGQRRVALGQLGVVLGLARLEADVLEHHDVAVRARRRASARERDRRRRAARRAARPPGRSENSGSRSFGRPRWATQHEPRALLAQLLERRQRRADARVVGDAAVLVQRDVEVDPDEDALALDVEVVERAHAPAPSGRAPRSGSSSPTRCRTRRRP